MSAINGHRGARDLWPENSLTGFRKSAQMGCDALEFDVHLTDAGELVVIHDATLERTVEASGAVRHLSPKARAETRLRGTDEPIPTLDEVLALLAPQRGLGLHVEIKLDAEGKAYPGIAARVVAALQAHELAGRAHLTSFDSGILHECRAIAPGIARLLSADATWVARQGGLADFAARASGLADIIALRHDYFLDELEAITAIWPLETLCAWTINDAPTLGRFLALGVGHITTDRPDIALALRRNLGSNLGSEVPA